MVLETRLQKESLRKILLEKRDSTSFDFIKIASKKIQENLKKINAFQKAKNTALYYPKGSEVLTQDIIQELISQGKQVFLPAVQDRELIFRKINDSGDLQVGKFDIMEPKENCPVAKDIDVVIVPAIGVSRQGYRLGYGHGYYDRFLRKTKAVSVVLIYAKQVVKYIPHEKNDQKVDWVVTEKEYFKTL